MAKLLSFDSFTSAKSLSDSVITSNSKKNPVLSHSLVAEKLSNIRKSKSSPSPEQKSSIFNWFKDQNPLRLHSIFHITDPFWCSILIQMYIHKYNNGYFLFAQQPNPSKNLEYYDLRSLFYLKKSKPSLLNQEILLEQALRFSANNEYCDSLALCTEILKSPQVLFKVFEDLSNGKAFTSPCQLSGDRKIMEYPNWLNLNENYSLATWLAWILEKEIWVHYMTDKGLIINELTYVPEESLSVTLHFFSSVKKLKIFQDAIRQESLKSMFLEIKEKASSVPDMVGPAISDIHKYLKSKRNFQNELSLDLVSEYLLKNDLEFIEFLKFSPVVRVGSIFDLLLQSICLKLKELKSSVLADSLSSLEITKKPKTLKPGQKNRKEKLVQFDKKDYKAACEQMTSVLVSKIFSDLYKSLPKSQSYDEDCHSISEDFHEITGDNPQTAIQKKSTKRTLIQSQTLDHQIQKPRVSKPQVKRKKTPSQAQGKKSAFFWGRGFKYSKAPGDKDFPPLCPVKEQNDSLHLEIFRYVETTVRKVQDKFQYIYVMLQRLECIISEQLGGRIILFGSYATGLAIELSDIDLGIIGVEVHNRVLLNQAILTLTSSLKLVPFVTLCSPILTARIPVIKLQIDLACFTGAPCPGLVDISFVETFDCAHQGFQAIPFTKDLLILFPSIRYLTIVLKNFLYSIGLNSSYHGGLNSYSLVLWITASLNSMKSVPDDYGLQLEYFLDFFGNKFNPLLYGVDVVNRGSLFKLDGKYYNEHAVTIDPTNKNNNTTRSSFKINEVISEFSQAHSRIKESFKTGKKKQTLSQIFKKFNR